MVTYALVFLSTIEGIAMIAAGVWGGLRLKQISATQRGRMPLRYYAIVAGMIGSGIGLLGIAQALRLLIWIYEGGSLGSD
jgi:hypothetical protein